MLRLLLSFLATCFSAIGALGADSLMLEIDRARASSDSLTGRPVVELHLSRDAQAVFGSFTEDNVGAQVDLMVDGEVLTSPVIRTPIYGSMLQISGIDTLEEAEALALRLSQGDAQVEVRLSPS